MVGGSTAARRGAKSRSTAPTGVSTSERHDALGSAPAVEPAAAWRRRLLAERAGARDEVLRRQAHQLLVPELLHVSVTQPQRLCIQRLLEQGARQARVAETLVARSAA